MKKSYFRILIVLAFLATFAFANGLPVFAADYIVTQITDNSVDDKRPKINNRGDIAWGEGHNIFQYESSTQSIVHLSSDGGDDPIHMNNYGDMVWAEDDVIYLYNATTKITTQFANDEYSDSSPDLNDNGEVVWSGNPNERLLNILYYDGSTVHELPNSHWPSAPSIGNNGHIVWSGRDENDNEIYLYDGFTTTKLTDDEYDDSVPLINDYGQVAWFKNIYAGGEGQEIFLYDGLITKKLSNGGTANNSFDINNNGDVVWEHHQDSGYPFEIHLHESSTQTVTQIGLGWQPQINDEGSVTWFDSSGEGIYVCDGSTTIQLSTDGFHPDINNNGDVVWDAHDGNDYEIFYARLITEPTIDAILDFFDQSVADGTLEGHGPGKSANARLYALRNMLEMASDLIGIDDIEGACLQLNAALGKCDGDPLQPDFVKSEAVTGLYDMIFELMEELECE